MGYTHFISLFDVENCRIIFFTISAKQHATGRMWPKFSNQIKLYSTKLVFHCVTVVQGTSKPFNARLIQKALKGFRILKGIPLKAFEVPCMSYLRYSLHKSNNYSRLYLVGAGPRAKILNQYFMKKVKAYQNKISL